MTQKDNLNGILPKSDFFFTRKYNTSKASIRIIYEGISNSFKSEYQSWL